MKEQKLTLEIGIPAYNEEANIANLLNYLLFQKSNNFILRKITVYSDNSSDSTSAIVKSLQKKHRVIGLVDDKERRGKLYRLNQMFSNCNSDILVTLDADIGLKGRNFLDNLIEPIIKDGKAQMVTAHEIALSPSNFFGKIIYHGFLNWDYIRLEVPNRDHVQNLGGAAVAYRSTFAKRLKIPSGVREERLYIYLMAKKMEGFRYCDNAQMYFWPVSTFKDFIGLTRRSFGEDEEILDRIFGFKVSERCTIPAKYKVRGLVKAALKDPFYAPLGLFVNILLGKIRPKKKIIKTDIWDSPVSTKKLINV